MEAIVMHNYVAQEPDELTLRQGDIIKEIKVLLGGWWEGTLRDKRGMFPDSFVKVLEESVSASTTSGSGSNGGGSDGLASTKNKEVSLRNGGSGRRWCKVLFSYEPCNDDELTLVPQDSIEFLGEVEEGWWRGRLKGKLGVFPSNFVSPPMYEEQDKHKEREKKEFCRVLFPYTAANEDELTLLEGETITLLSRDAPDKGWWKGELRGRIGLFPDNFVEVIGAKSEYEDQEQWHEPSGINTKATTKHAHRLKKNDKTSAKQNLDVRNVHADCTKKVTSTSTTSPVSSSTPLTCVGGASGDKKTVGNHSLISSLKHVVGEGGNNSGNGSTNVALNEELDGVERGEGAPLSHLTASRAKAPRRRPPSSQHLRYYSAGSTASSAISSHSSLASTTLDDKMSNGNAENTLSQLRQDEVEGLAAKAKVAPWVKELKMNQMERRKISTTDRVDKGEVKKEKSYSWIVTTATTADGNVKLDAYSEDGKQKDKEKNTKSETSACNYGDHVAKVSSSGLPPFVPYHLYNQLLERVAALEEKQELLQQTVSQLSEQLTPLLANATINNKV